MARPMMLRRLRLDALKLLTQLSRSFPAPFPQGR